MSLTEQVSNKLTRKQKIILILSIGLMWLATTAYDIHLRIGLERYRIETRNESDRVSAEVLKQLLERLAEKKRQEESADSIDWSI